MRFFKTIFLLVFALVALSYLGGDLKDVFNSALNTAENYIPAQVSSSTVAGDIATTSEMQSAISSGSNKPSEPVNPSPEASAPSPLVNNNPPVSGDSGALSSAGVLKYTNDARLSNGLPALSLNAKLSTAAETKALDMLAKTYFEHISPSGVGPADIVKGAGYEYLSIGENLAMGIFKGDSDLVDAWMASPGHRANILGKHFTEIGVAVKKGMYQGQEVWMAVQEFGTPASLCNKPDQSLADQISNLSTELNTLKINLDNLRAQINATDRNDPKYNSLVSSYNNMVNEYNSEASVAQNLSNTYNQDVKTYNICLTSYTN